MFGIKMFVTPCRKAGRYFNAGGNPMLPAQLYFLSNQYYLDFPDDKLMKNKDVIGGVPHNRPCFFAFHDNKIPEIYWIVPISSKVEKFKQLEQEKIKKYGHCNTIRFGTVLGRQTAFLIQNMCPATEKYLTAYIDKNKQPIRIDDRVAADIEKNARAVLGMAKRGAKVIFPDVFKIYHGLEEQLVKEVTAVLPDITEKPSIRAQLRQPLKNQPSKAMPSKSKSRDER